VIEVSLPPLAERRVLGMRVDATSYADATARVIRWAEAREARYVCVATVNNVMEAYDDPSFMRVMNDADLVTPDGMPLVWALRLLGVTNPTRVYGPELTPHVLAAAERSRIPVGFYGGSPDVLRVFRDRVAERYPSLEVAYAWSPPFRELTPEERRETVDSINASGARIVFVGIGCPKQERWMAEHRASVGAVTLGVGAAFDFIAGRKRQAPAFLQRLGLEWLFRLATEPRRLWRRYLRHNPRFVALFGAQLLRSRSDHMEVTSR
jgi:N-acetylglucosaminyldiphosphoundecaprenol N-acetyl-beta-D-mannosaminyltransferase